MSRKGLPVTLSSESARPPNSKPDLPVRLSTACLIATWRELEIAVFDVNGQATTISLSPNERIIASTSLALFGRTAQLWDLETNQPIGTPLHHEGRVNSATFSTDGKFLVTYSAKNGVSYGRISTWDVSAIIKEAGLLTDIADAPPRPAPKIEGARRIPPGFFDDALREAYLRTRLSQSNEPNNRPTPAPRQRILSHLSSFWRHFKSHRATEPHTQPQSRPLSWARNLISGMMRRRDVSSYEHHQQSKSRAAGRPRDYHAGTALSSRPPNPDTTQQPSEAAQSTPSSSQQQPPAAAASTLSIVASAAGTTGTLASSHHRRWMARSFCGLCLSRTPMANIRDAISTTALATGTPSRRDITVI
ncbi:hypothetical protein EDB19DRAFT_1912684 [Suillus lakei]|nr:hypothetical protein EDB19DRAFT_1912684 [Suillus lakei]